MIGWLIVGAARSAARNSGKPGKQQEWQPLTKIVWWFFIFAIPIAIGGGWRIAAFVILGIIAASVLVGLVYGVTHRNDIRKPAASDVDKVLDDLLGGKEGSGKP